MPNYEPGLFYPGLFDQDDTWIDRFGREHQIDFMDQDYVENVLCFLLDNAVRFQRRYMIEVDGIDPFGLPEPELVALYSIPRAAARRWVLRTELGIALMGRLSQ